MIDNIRLLADRMEDEVIRFRRELHQIPEISYELPQTSAYVEEKLRSFGIGKIRAGICGYGITAEIEGMVPGKTIALRADMDGLPVTEATGCEFAYRK